MVNFIAKGMRNQQLPLRLVGPVALLFLLLGLNVGTWVSRLADFKIILAITDSQLGLMLLGCSVGAVCAYPVTLRMLTQVGARRTAVIAICCAAVLLPLLAVSTNYILSVIIMFFEGVICAVINASMNMLGSQLEKKTKRRVISRLHAIFSLGVGASALLSMFFLWAELPLFIHFSSVSLFSIFCILKITHRLIDVSAQTEKNTEEKKSNVSGVFVLLGVTVFFSTIIEGGMFDWSGLYLNDVIGVAHTLIPVGMLTFSFAMFVGRLLADGLREKTNDLLLITIAGLLVFFSLSIGVFIGGLWASIVSFAAVGLTIAIVTPSIYALSANQGPACLSLVTMLGSSGGLLGPPLIGFGSEYFGLKVSFYFVAGCGLAITILSMLLTKVSRKHWQQPVVVNS
ncbi:MFS transporter [Aliikangiella coralliicola]|uniref:MFS transporter n=1 Tax=Aliikangiella coralliicola TaxID=2592383 RepID=A0A545UCY0_9GAMM|nr:MFS transporter [Aliikangiella coralliicola]TQV87326.1 MFS transporter [Aliikangiella coralliicola]